MYSETGTATLVWSRDFGLIPGGNYFALDFCGGVQTAPSRGNG
jgi:hypothetical protein